MTIHQRDPIILGRALCGPYPAKRVDWREVTCARCLKRRAALFALAFLTVMLTPGCL